MVHTASVPPSQSQLAARCADCAAWPCAACIAAECALPGTGADSGGEPGAAPGLDYRPPQNKGSAL